VILNEEERILVHNAKQKRSSHIPYLYSWSWTLLLHQCIGKIQQSIGIMHHYCRFSVSGHSEFIYLCFLWLSNIVHLYWWLKLWYHCVTVGFVMCISLKTYSVPWTFIAAPLHDDCHSLLTYMKHSWFLLFIGSHLLMMQQS